MLSLEKKMRDQAERLKALPSRKLSRKPSARSKGNSVTSRRKRSGWPVYSYLIVYRADPLEIIAILHGTRELKAFFAKLDED
jgi:plasmid stabilization system protein ParE